LLATFQSSKVTIREVSISSKRYPEEFKIEAGVDKAEDLQQPGRRPGRYF